MICDFLIPSIFLNVCDVGAISQLIPWFIEKCQLSAAPVIRVRVRMSALSPPLFVAKLSRGKLKKEPR